jgi:transposase
MRLKHNKTDKADASMIRLNAQQEEPELWRAKIAYREECMKLEGVIRLLPKQRTALKNKFHSLISKGSESKTAIRSIKSQILRLTKEVEKLEVDMK